MKIIIGWMALLLAQPAAAHGMACSDRADIIAQLATRYSEAPEAAGITADHALIELLTSPDGGTFTLMITRRTEDGRTISCLLGVGQDWHPVDRPPPGQRT